MINNGGSLYRSLYGSAPLNVPNSFSKNSHSIHTQYNSVFQQESQHRPIINQQNTSKLPNISLFKLYDLDTNDDSEIIRLIFSFLGITYKDNV